ncbi:hypothetical protein GCM10010343_00780 [Streptomyces avidinii]|nr:hypothetical protein GCM10010343_00780 [Streptomyces avidinii]
MAEPVRGPPPERRREPEPVPEPERGLGAVGCGTSSTTGMPEGSLAPVSRASSSSEDLICAVRGEIPASDIRRVMSRFWSGSTRVTTLPDSPARAVRPPRCR